MSNLPYLRRHPSPGTAAVQPVRPRRGRLGIPGSPEVALLRRRRRVATCLACAAGAVAFFGLYVLSWMLVLEI